MFGLMGRSKSKFEKECGEDRYKIIFKYSPYVILCTDEKNIVLEANNAMARLTGFKPDEIIGHDVYKVLFSPRTSAFLRLRASRR